MNTKIKDLKETNQSEKDFKNNLIERAKVVELDVNSTEAQIVRAEANSKKLAKAA